MKRVTGIGGIFFKAKDPEGLKSGINSTSAFLRIVRVVLQNLMSDML
jgi:hypothetical protein